MQAADDSFPFWKNTILVMLFFIVAPLTLATSVFSLFVISDSKHKSVTQVALASAEYNKSAGVQVFASLPSSFPSISSYIEAADARGEKIRQYLKYYNSNLEPFAQTLVGASDFYGLDWRLLTAISQQESNLCKWIPPGSHNCWGWGIHSEGTLGFGSYEEAIWTVAKGLKEEYISKGYQTPGEIMSKYTPLSKGSWAQGVVKFMAELE